MASPITTTATTLEGQFLEVMEAIASTQAVTAQNPDNINLLTTYSRNMATGAITFSGTIPTTDTTGTGGTIVVGAMSIYVD